MSQTTSQTCAYEYTVRRGDSFYLIAHRLGVPLKDLLEANSDINPARLMVGDVLCIPGAAAETPDTNITAPTTPDASDTTTNDALDAPAADMNAPATPGGETPDISFCPEIDRYTVLQGETAADVQLTPYAGNRESGCEPGRAAGRAGAVRAGKSGVPAGQHIHAGQGRDDGDDGAAAERVAVGAAAGKSVPCAERLQARRVHQYSGGLTENGAQRDFSHAERRFSICNYSALTIFSALICPGRLIVIAPLE